VIATVAGLVCLALVAWYARSRQRENVRAFDCGEEGCIYCDPHSIADAFGPRAVARVVYARKQIPSRLGLG
jgi:hypothetical protein